MTKPQWRCATCQHYDPPLTTKQHEKGMCLRVFESDTLVELGGWLEVSPDFGCIQWEPTL